MPSEVLRLGAAVKVEPQYMVPVSLWITTYHVVNKYSRQVSSRLEWYLHLSNKQRKNNFERELCLPELGDTGPPSAHAKSLRRTPGEGAAQSPGESACAQTDTASVDETRDPGQDLHSGPKCQ